LTEPTAKLVVLAALAVLAVGCAPSSFESTLAVEKRELGDVYDYYTAYLKINGRAPTDAPAFEDEGNVQSAGMRALRDGKYKVVWGVTDKSGGTLLAYQAEPAEEGVVVLMADGTVKRMTAAQFKNAKPAP
jgi:hypothetical protein